MDPLTQKTIEDVVHRQISHLLENLLHTHNNATRQIIGSAQLVNKAMAVTAPGVVEGGNTTGFAAKIQQMPMPQEVKPSVFEKGPMPTLAAPVQIAMPAVSGV